jgi:hypothetical protein
MPKVRVLPIGSVVHGTLRELDLIDAFLEVTNTLVMNKDDRIEVNWVKKKRRKYDDDTGGCQLDTPVDEELMDYMLWLEDTLNKYVPELCYFGVHEGDASDFGVWPMEFEVECEVDNGEISDGRKEANRFHKLAWEGEDGVGTLYRRAGTSRWKVLWSTVT